MVHFSKDRIQDSQILNNHFAKLLQHSYIYIDIDKNTSSIFWSGDGMNRTVKGAKLVHGKDPQLLVEKIIRERIFETRYWKENCFGMNVEKLLEQAASLNYVGGTYSNQKPTPFLCLILRMLQLQPSEEIIQEFIVQEDFKYLRILGLFYYRLVTHSSSEIYRTLEGYLQDKRNLRVKQRNGTFSLTFVDGIVDSLLRDDRVFDIILPRLTCRMVLEDTEDLEPRPMLLSDFEEAEIEGLEPTETVTLEEEDEEEIPSAAVRIHEELSIKDTNEIRAKLGLKPLQ